MNGADVSNLRLNLRRRSCKYVSNCWFGSWSVGMHVFVCVNFDVSVSTCVNPPVSVSDCVNLGVSVSACVNVGVSVSALKNLGVSISARVNLGASISACVNPSVSVSACVRTRALTRTTQTLARPPSPLRTRPIIQRVSWISISWPKCSPERAGQMFVRNVWRRLIGLPTFCFTPSNIARKICLWRGSSYFERLWVVTPPGKSNRHGC